ncbi:GFA family protein [Palleronia sp. KMU-117]|uniref:GFA family protein n=1 Tax=Palleronia sp. KMU-117 TaxID=3434108 RepID=UPI003D74C12C
MNGERTEGAGCLCGAVRVTVRNRPAAYGICHCRMCQRWSGLVFAAVNCPPDRVEIAGADHIATYQSSDWAERAWCTRCGSHLWYRVTSKGAHQGDYEMPIGLFDNPDGFILEREIFIDRKSDAFDIAGTHPRMTEAEVFAIYGADSSGA